ncbi:MAG TPA: glycosyltransferase [Candidatus Brocadiia bacterium]|nr:glycosyltransferase [Candidatus Brocadiia bacterium]
MPDSRNTPPSVLHIDTEMTWRGGEQQMLYLASGLAARGWRSEAACRPGSAALERCAAAGIAAHKVQMRGEWDLPAARKIATIASGKHFDILHAHTAHAVVLGGMAARMARPRPLTVAHRRIDYSIHKLPLRLSLLKYLHCADHFIAVSGAVKRVMISDGVPEERISVVHSSTDPSRFTPDKVKPDPALRAALGIPPAVPVVGNVGYLVSHKAQNFLLDAFAVALRQVPDAHLLIIGEGNLRADLVAQARRLGIADRVHLPGFRKDVPQLLGLMDVFALSSWAEGTPGTLCEAACARVPIVTTDAGGIPELIRDGQNGIMVPCRDSASLARGITTLLTNRTLAAKYAEESYRTVTEDFCAEKLVEKTVAVYKRLLGDAAYGVAEA